MKQTYILLILLMLFNTTAHAQVRVYDREKYNPELKKELDNMYKKDQQYRKYFTNTSDTTRDSLAKAFHVKATDLHAHLEKLQAEVDTQNMVDLQTIIRHYDYPGKTLVGEPTNMVAAIIIMHSKSGQRYYPRINQSYVMGELPQMAVAMLEDHILVQHGKRQNYGSCTIAVPIKDTVTGKVITRYFISPIKDMFYINDMRKSRGFRTGIKEYAQELGVIYDPYLTPEKLERIRYKKE